MQPKQSPLRRPLTAKARHQEYAAQLQNPALLLAAHACSFRSTRADPAVLPCVTGANRMGEGHCCSTPASHRGWSRSSVSAVDQYFRHLAPRAQPQPSFTRSEDHAVACLCLAGCAFGDRALQRRQLRESFVSSKSWNDKLPPVARV